MTKGITCCRYHCVNRHFGCNLVRQAGKSRTPVKSTRQVEVLAGKMKQTDRSRVRVEERSTLLQSKKHRPYLKGQISQSKQRRLW